ncbi:MAG: hypothetical protein V3V01_17820 [Acidimicrobiales bacterium]
MTFADQIAVVTIVAERVAPETPSPKPTDEQLLEEQRRMEKTREKLEVQRREREEAGLSTSSVEVSLDQLTVALGEVGASLEDGSREVAAEANDSPSVSTAYDARLDQTLWLPSTVRADLAVEQGATFSLPSYGLWQKDGRLSQVRPGDGPRMVAGKSYIVAMFEFDGKWSMLTDSSVIPIRDGALDETGVVSKTARGIAGLTVSELRVKLASIELSDEVKNAKSADGIPYLEVPPLIRATIIVPKATSTE